MIVSCTNIFLKGVMNYFLLKLLLPSFGLHFPSGFTSLSNSPCGILFDMGSGGALPKQDGCHELSDMNITPSDDFIILSIVSDPGLQFVVD